jgi:hypothetical protein
MSTYSLLLRLEPTPPSPLVGLVGICKKNARWVPSTLVSLKGQGHEIRTGSKWLFTSVIMNRVVGRDPVRPKIICMLAVSRIQIRMDPHWICLLDLDTHREYGPEPDRTACQLVPKSKFTTSLWQTRFEIFLYLSIGADMCTIQN